MREGEKFKHWMVIASFSKDIEGLELERCTRPMKVGNVRTPSSLDDMTLGQMVQMSDCKTGAELFYRVCNVLLGMEAKKVDDCFAVEVVRFVGWVLGKVKTINELFDKAKSQPSDEEIRAGFNQLNFGIFGLIDWYALRMGITDHEEVTKVPWGRVYKCLDMDKRTNDYRKKLQKVYEDEHRK